MFFRKSRSFIIFANIWAHEFRNIVVQVNFYVRDFWIQLKVYIIIFVKGKKHFVNFKKGRVLDLMIMFQQKH